MVWTELILLVSVVFNWMQWGEIKETKVERDLYRAEANLCDEARKDARRIELQQADERAEKKERIGRIISRSELDIRRTYEARSMDSGDTDCRGVVSPAGNQRMEKITKRTSEINKALRPTGPSNDAKSFTRTDTDAKR